MQEGSVLHEDSFEPKVNFAWVAVLHGGLISHKGSFLYESKKTLDKLKQLRGKLLKKYKKKLPIEGKS